MTAQLFGDNHLHRSHEAASCVAWRRSLTCSTWGVVPSSWRVSCRNTTSSRVMKMVTGLLEPPLIGDAQSQQQLAHHACALTQRASEEGRVSRVALKTHSEYLKWIGV